jgi:hemin uptake protein HemP
MLEAASHFNNALQSGSGLSMSSLKPTLSKPVARGAHVKTAPFGPALPCVRSEDLLGNDREIMIEHAGVYYRLRVTRANKLILTK